MPEEKPIWEPVECLWNIARTEVKCNDTDGSLELFYELEPELEPSGTPTFYFYLFSSIFLICFAGAMSGLTIGLMSFDEKNLEILKIQSTDEKEKRHATRVSILIRDHHLLLVTLLVWNAAALETLPIFLDRIVPSWAAVLISVTLILIVGEVIPQAFCTGPRRLQIASSAFYFVLILMLGAYPISYFFARLLDKLLGTREERDSQFMYLPKKYLGLDDDGRLALVEVHGFSDRVKKKKNSSSSVNNDRASRSLLDDNDEDDDTMLQVPKEIPEHELTDFADDGDISSA